ncbi:HEAT repeat domain-containing protein [Chitinophaga rhizophila]|uniref:HEAT repeat domain-containing protein n=1 Tax=Chitinophaga rhizophila TaxID=2866212 RepID=A0ABS7G8Z5_9BACT|nr:HEAT repeat domain-containing protein [Chitinophaga rhizophila]MBW8683866.1 HEAT repeat domain-containing protein [Chitinophaga rhizophila]
MDNTTQHSLPGLIRKVLGSPHAEQVIKAQIIQLASQQLHVPEVTTALLEVLPQTKDKETRDKLLFFLSSLNTSRFSDLRVLFDTLLQVFQQEKDRDTRTALLYRLQESLHQDSRLASFFISLAADSQLSEREMLAVQDALSTLPAITQDIALAALSTHKNAPTILQLQALTLAEKCTAWGPEIVAALQPYLDVKNDREVRIRILKRLADAKLLDVAYVPLLIQVLHTDNDPYMRSQALLALQRIRPWTGDMVAQLYWSSTKDSDEGIRQQALLLQKEMPELSNEQLIQLAELLATDRSEGVRLTLLGLLKPVMRIPEIRNAVAGAFSSHPGVFDNAEFNQLVEMLTPYAGRDAVISTMLLESINGLPNTDQRRKVLSLLIGRLKTEQVIDQLVALFRKERDESLREVLFNQVKALSVARHPQLVDVFCTELTEPGSPFRITCAGILAGVASLYPQIVPALEDVLQYDTERELVRLCLDGYLRPGVEQRFDVLLSVVRNESTDLQSRQKALDAVIKLTLDTSQQDELTTALAGIKPNTLKTS